MTGATPAEDVPISAMPCQPPITIRGDDIRRWVLHWRESRLHRLEVQLVRGDVVFFDVFALRTFYELYSRVAVTRLNDTGGPPPVDVDPADDPGR